MFIRRLGPFVLSGSAATFRVDTVRLRYAIVVERKTGAIVTTTILQFAIQNVLIIL